MKSIDTDIKTLSDLEIAPCLASGPIAEKASELVRLSQKLGNGITGTTLRCWVTMYVFGAMEKAFSQTSDPNITLNQLLTHINSFISHGPELESCFLASLTGATVITQPHESTEERTGTHYSLLFGKFSPQSFWDEPTELLKVRLVRNGISDVTWKGKVVLDAGCGGGRYTVAWKKLGASEAIGLDLSPRNVQNASERVSLAQLEHVRFLEGSTLNLPFEDSSFDVVFSNGVLHHTNNWRKGADEIVRVLKPGGLGWLYLIENPGGLYWDLIEVLRVVMKNENSETARHILASMGVPANRVFYMLDHVMAPINSMLSPTQIEDALKAAGASGIKRLSRGVDFDRIEKIYRKEPFAEIKYGVGENRYIFTK